MFKMIVLSALLSSFLSAEEFGFNPVRIYADKPINTFAITGDKIEWETKTYELKTDSKGFLALSNPSKTIKVKPVIKAPHQEVVRVEKSAFSDVESVYGFVLSKVGDEGIKQEDSNIKIKSTYLIPVFVRPSSITRDLKVICYKDKTVFKNNGNVHEVISPAELEGVHSYILAKSELTINVPSKDLLKDIDFAHKESVVCTESH